MLGMSFLSFLTLTIIGGLVALTYQFVFKYRMMEGIDALFTKMVVGWVGAWLGSPVLGHWLWKIEGVYIIPAIFGSIALVHLQVMAGKAAMKIATTTPARREEIPTKRAAA